MKVNMLFIVNFVLTVAGFVRSADGAWGNQQGRVDTVGDIRNGIDNQQNTTKCVHSYYHKAFDHYSKIVFLDEDLEATLLPVEDYPLDESLGDILKTQSMASSPMTAADLPEIDANELIRKIGGLPAFPGEQVFWDELMEVALFQAHRILNARPPFRLPEIWRGFDIEEVAQAVHNDFPGYWHQKLLEIFWAKGLHMDYSIVPFHSNVDFVGTTVGLAALNTWAIGEICHPNFLVKWTVGKLRPEEAAFQITNNLMEGVPLPLKYLIDWMDLTNPEQFTAYPEGSPSHPSWPAMHSAASAASLWLATVADLTDEQYCQVLLTDYAIAFARTVAGVHYSSDNIAGLNLGQHLVAEALPEYLTVVFGANKTAVEEKVAQLRFDWTNFDPTSCSILPDN
jgi:membrane-associated phospholipid phosphatase